MNKKYDMIQLPPLPKDTDAETLKLLWEYAKVPDEGQKRMKEYFEMTLKLANHPIDKTKEIYELPSDGLESFRTVMKDMIGDKLLLKDLLNISDAVNEMHDHLIEIFGPFDRGGIWGESH